MARFYVFTTQSAAQDAVEAINIRARQLYAARGYTVDGDGKVVGKRASDGADQPDACRTETWDIPRQRADGSWVVAHTETCPGHDIVVDPEVGTLAWEYVMQDISAPVETLDSDWFPTPDPSS